MGGINTDSFLTKSKLYRKMKKSKVKKNVVKLTGLRDSQYDRYMKKFQSKATCQCHTMNARSIKPVRSDFSLLKTLKIFMSNIAEQKNRVYRKLKANKVKTSLVKYTVLRASQYDGYIKKFIRLLQEKANDRAISKGACT